MKLETFDFNSHAVRVVDQNGEPWFVAVDVCRILDLQNVTQALGALDSDERAMFNIGRQGETNIISESGMYVLVLRSRKPEAKKFRKWVTAEVLPAIRKTGRYGAAVEGQAAALSAPVERVSLFGFVHRYGQEWPVKRQMEFGTLATRYCRSLGLPLLKAEEPMTGLVQVYPLGVLEDLNRRLQSGVVLADPLAPEFERFLEHVFRCHGARLYKFLELRDLAMRDGYFPHLPAQGTVLAQRSAFGKLLARFNGQIFPNGLLMQMRGNRERSYDLRRVISQAPEAVVLKA